MKRNDSNQQCLSLEAIKAYLSNEVKEPEQAKFADHFASCALCEEVRESFSTINQMGVEEDITDLQDKVFDSINHREATTRRFFLSRIAAGILLPILGIGGYFFLSSNSNERLYQEYYQSYLILDTNDTRSVGGVKQYENISLPKDLELAFDSFKAKKYQESIPHFKAYRTTQAQNTQANFFYALANLETGNTTTAIPVLEDISNTDSSFKEDAIWYLALIKIKKKDNSGAKALLKTLNTSKFYSLKASELIQKI